MPDTEAQGPKGSTAGSWGTRSPEGTRSVAGQQRRGQGAAAQPGGRGRWGEAAVAGMLDRNPAVAKALTCVLSVTMPHPRRTAAPAASA
ncbi:hypothetical protein GCM10023235_10250 [Kitasatospora terrestris]|uniref:Uncharacterized protein n=1 Tax=Kitasatospora terrestris TaxID=258051 RepID=A0ABP9DAE1_9ACTN